MIRLLVYKNCSKCMWFGNPIKCNEYETCKNCPNSTDGNCICCEQKPEDEKQCPHFKKKTMTIQELKDRIAKLEKEVETRKAEVLHLQEYGKKLIRETELKQFAEKLKGKLQDFGDGGEKGAYITEKDIDETLKEYEK